MVSLHRIPELEHSSEKRKWDDLKEEQVFGKRFKHENETSILDIELHLETPLPFDWQRCLDIQSGHVYFYNTRTKERTSRDPRKSEEEQSSEPNHMSLDLELNLPYESLIDQSDHNHHDDHDNLKHNNSSNGPGLNDSRSWLSFGEEDDQQEMVAAVCKKCFMLVMLCKASPACPNCKFMHPREHSTSTATTTTTTLNLFKKRFISQLLY